LTLYLGIPVIYSDVTISSVHLLTITPDLSVLV